MTDHVEEAAQIIKSGEVTGILIKKDDNDVKMVMSGSTQELTVMILNAIVYDSEVRDTVMRALGTAAAERFAEICPINRMDDDQEEADGAGAE